VFFTVVTALLSLGVCLPTSRTRSPCVAFSHPMWSKYGECLFGANLASVSIRLFRAKPLPALNIISVQDKAAWSPCACDKAQTPAMPTFVRCLLRGRNDLLCVR